MTEGTRLEDLVRNLEAENNGYQQHITALTGELNHERETVTALRANQNANAPGPQSFPVPDPERFDGTRHKLCPFRSHLLMKLQGDSA